MNNKSGSEKIALECTRCGATTVPTKYVSYREIQKYQRNHHTLCNSSPNHPIGASGGSCSCRVVHNSEWRDLQKLCEEQKREIVRLERLVIATETGSRYYFRCAENCEKHVDELESQLATQTEKARVMREALKKIVLITERRTATMHGEDLKCQHVPYNCYCDEIVLANLAKQALNQDSLGDGK